MKRVTRERGKVKMHLVMSPVLADLAEVLDHGNRQPGRGPFNWRQRRILRSDMIAGAMRHLQQAEAGVRRDHQSGKDPLAHALARIFILLDAQHHGMAVDTRVLAKRKTRKGIR